MLDDRETAELFDLCSTMPADERTLLVRILRADRWLRPVLLRMAEHSLDLANDLVASGQPWITPSRPV
jgi:hypothetical protein